MFSLRLGRISISNLQWYLILIVYQLQYVNYSNGDIAVDKNLDIIVRNSSHIGINSHNKLQNITIISTNPTISNDTNTRTYTNHNLHQDHHPTRFCKNNVFKRGLEEILLASQGRNKISVDYLTQSIFDFTRRVNEVLFRPDYNEKCEYDKFAKTLFNSLQQMEGIVISGFIEINTDIDRILKLVNNSLFNSHNHTEGICYNQHLQKTLRNKVKQLSITIVNSFKLIMQVISKLSSLTKNGPQNDQHFLEENCNYEYVRNDLVEADLKLQTDTGTSFYTTMRVSFDMTRIIGIELHDHKQKDFKLIENMMAAVNDALEDDEIRTDLSKKNKSNNPPLPNSSEIFTNPCGCPLTNIDETNLKLSPKAQSAIKEAMLVASSEALGDLLIHALEFLAPSVFKRNSSSSSKINSDEILQVINKDSIDTNCSKYYDELGLEIRQLLSETTEFGRITVEEIIKYCRNFTEFLSKQNSGNHFLPPILRITEWLSAIEMLYEEALAFIEDYTPVFLTYIETIERTRQNIISTTSKILNPTCLGHLLRVFQINTTITEDIIPSKQVRKVRDIRPLFLKLAQNLPNDLAQFGQEINQLNTTPLPTHAGTTSIMPSSAIPNGNDSLAEWINLIRFFSDELLKKITILYNLSS